MTEPVFDYKYIQSMFRAASKRIHKIFTMFEYTWTGAIPSENEIFEFLIRCYKEAETLRLKALSVNECMEWVSSGRIIVFFDYDKETLNYDDIKVAVELGNFWNHWNEDLGHEGEN